MAHLQLHRALPCSSQHRHPRPFSSCMQPATRCRPVTATVPTQQQNPPTAADQPGDTRPQHQASAPSQLLDQASAPSQLLRSWVQVAPVAVVSGLTAGAAYADDAADAVYAAANSQGPTDLVVTAMAGFVFVLLLVVTGGVAYLNLSSWLDDRQEKKDREVPVFTSSVASSSRDEGEVRRRVKVKKEKRGFGSN